MGCGSSTGAAVVDQNGNQPPPPPQTQKQNPTVVEVSQAQPKQAPVQQTVATQERAPPKQPTPPPPKKSTPPPPKEPTPPPPKEPTPPQTTEPASTVKGEQTQDDDKLTAEIMNEFIQLEKQIQQIEKMQHEEKQMFFKFELKNTEDALKAKEEEFKAAHEVALKEYADYANFNIQEFMASNQISYLSPQQAEAAFDREKQEYLEAKNKLDSCQKEVEQLQSEISSIRDKVAETNEKVNDLYKLQDKQDGLLENVFHGDYGSELEDKLENEYEDIREKRDRYVLAAMKWKTCKDVLSKACSQLAYSTARWNQIQEYPNIPNQAKFYMATETRNALIAGHMNARHANEQLQGALPYWNAADDKNLVMSINIIYNEVTRKKTFDRALAWYKYYHWRLALSLNWVEQVLRQLHQQMNSIETELKGKYQQLKMERLKCIQWKVKEKLGIDLNIEEFTQEQSAEGDEGKINLTATIFNLDNSKDVENMEEMPVPKENENPTSLEVIAAENSATANDGAVEESEEKPGEEVSEETPVTDEPEKPKAPPIRNIPLDELAPLPSYDELIGKVEKLLETVENAEETLEKNKLRQEQNLQEQLRRRRSRRKRMRDQTKQDSKPESSNLETVNET